MMAGVERTGTAKGMLLTVSMGTVMRTTTTASKMRRVTRVSKVFKGKAMRPLMAAMAYSKGTPMIATL